MHPHESCSHYLRLDGGLSQYREVRSFQPEAPSYAGSPFPVEVLKKCIRKFGNKFYQGYGATETAGAAISGLASYDHHLDGPKSKYLASAGKPAPMSRVKIVDENDQTLGPGE